MGSNDYVHTARRQKYVRTANASQRQYSLLKAYTQDKMRNTLNEGHMEEEVGSQAAATWTTGGSAMLSEMGPEWKPLAINAPFDSCMAP